MFMALLIFGISQVALNGIIGLAILLLVSIDVYKHSRIANYINNRFLRKRDLNRVAKERSAEFASCGLINIDEQGSIIAWNKYATDLFKWKEREIIGKNINIIISKESLPSYYSLQAEHSNTQDPTVIQIECCTKEKIKIPVEVSVSKLEFDDTVLYILVARDISHRIGNEQQRKILTDAVISDQLKLLNLYKRGEETDRTGVWHWNVLEKDESRAMEVTDGVRKILLLGKSDATYEFIMRKVHHLDHGVFNEALLKVLRGENSEFTYRAIRSDFSIALLFCKWEAALTSPKPSTPTDIYATIRLLQNISEDDSIRMDQ